MVNENIIDIITQESVLQQLWKNIVKNYNITKTRHRRNVIFRHAFATAARANSDLSLKAVALIINKDHATVLHSMKQHEINYIYDDQYRNVYDNIAKTVTEQLSEYRFHASRKGSTVSIITADRGLRLQNEHLKRQIDNLKKDIEMLKELHVNQINSISKNYKQVVIDKEEAENKLKDFRRRYML